MVAHDRKRLLKAFVQHARDCDGYRLWFPYFRSFPQALWSAKSLYPISNRGVAFAFFTVAAFSVFTGSNFAIAALAAAIGYLFFESLRKML